MSSWCIKVQFNFDFSFTLSNEIQTPGHNIVRLCDIHVLNTACDSEAFQFKRNPWKEKAAFTDGPEWIWNWCWQTRSHAVMMSLHKKICKFVKETIFSPSQPCQVNSHIRIARYHIWRWRWICFSQMSLQNEARKESTEQPMSGIASRQDGIRHFTLEFQQEN